MWRWLTVFLLGGLLGTGFGVALGFFLFPFVFPPPAAMERLTQAEASKLVAKGTFVHANPSDPVHYGKGGVSVYQDVVFLHDDFQVGSRPCLPCLSRAECGQVTGTMFVDLGGLRAFKGSQKYAIPAGVDLTKFPSVVIWCEQFSVLISPADLTFEPGS